MSIKGPLDKFIEISTAKPDDFKGVKDLVVEALHTDPKIFTRARYETAIRNYGKYYLTAKDGGRVVGFISGFDDGVFYGYTGRLVVAEDYRRRGIGESLLIACIEEFKKAGITAVIAGVNEKNLASRALLKKAGFGEGGYLQVMKKL